MVPDNKTCFGLDMKKMIIKENDGIKLLSIYMVMQDAQRMKKAEY